MVVKKPVEVQTAKFEHHEEGVVKLSVETNIQLLLTYRLDRQRHLDD